MSLKPCRECKHRVSTEAKACPQCGATDPTNSQLLHGIVGFFTLSVILYFVFSDSDEVVTKLPVALTQSPEQVLLNARQHYDYISKQRLNNRIGLEAAWSRCRSARETATALGETLNKSDSKTIQAAQIYKKLDDFCYLVVTPKMWDATF